MSGDSAEVYGNTDMMQRIQCSFGTSSSSIPKQQTLLTMNQLDVPQSNPSHPRARHFSHFATNFGGDGSKRVGIPPSHLNQIPPNSPYSLIPVSRPCNQPISSQSFRPSPNHSRSLSQPSPFFSLASLPPLSPSPFRDSQSMMSDQVATDVSKEDRDENSHSVLPPSPFTWDNASWTGESLPPRNKHRRSNSDIPFGFSTVMQSSLPLISPRVADVSDRAVSRRENSGAPMQLVKKESSSESGGESNGEGMGGRKSEGEVVDDLFSAYMNLDNIDALNSSGTDHKNGNENHEDLDSRASGTKTNGEDSSDNEAESSVNESGNSLLRAGLNSSAEKKEGLKRTAAGDVTPTTRHYRSISMDSFMGKLNFADEPKLPTSAGPLPGQLSPSNSTDANSPAFSLEFRNGEFSGAELQKIMANEKLAEITLTDPKRIKRILANRQSAARSKERKLRYISELEHKVQTLQAEATTLSTQLTLLQRDSIGLTSQNGEMKFRIQAMEQQAQLREALNEALTVEVRRLKLATQEFASDSDPSKGMANQQHHTSSQMFQMQQPSQLNIHWLQQQQLQQKNGSTTAKPESNQ